MSFKDAFGNIKSYMESPIMKNMPMLANAPKLVFTDNPVHKTNKTIEELKEVIIQQGITSDKQSKNTKWLTYLALTFAFISIMPIVREYIPIIAPKNRDRDIYELNNKILSLSNTNLENQVRILKVENELQKAKKTSEKQKRIP